MFYSFKRQEHMYFKYNASVVNMIYGGMHEGNLSPRRTMSKCMKRLDDYLKIKTFIFKCTLYNATVYMHT